MDIETTLVLLIVGCALGFSIYKLAILGKDRYVENIRQWLVFACLEAEKLLGSKTGKVKLRYVYDMFINKFRFMAYIVPFELFSAWVDAALLDMKDIISNNQAVKELVEGDK